MAKYPRPKPHFTLLFVTLFACCFFQGKSSSWLNTEVNEVVMVQSRRQDWPKRCDFSVGKLVYDQSYPLYDFFVSPCKADFHFSFLFISDKMAGNAITRKLPFNFSATLMSLNKL
ncbi:hypothetical protein V6N13_141044 [Hibiscus sabdariffa]